MKKLNRKGFTLIELLAVIVIMGILMLVAIPAMQRYINNSKKKTYINTVKEIVNIAKNSLADKDDSLTCADGATAVKIISNDTNALESPAKSPYDSSKNITVYVTFDSNYKATGVIATDGTYKINSTIDGDYGSSTNFGKSITITEPTKVCTVKAE